MCIRDRNIALAYKAIDLKLLKLTDGKSILRWGDGNEQLTTIKLGQEPFEYIAKWFETDDGKEVLSAIMQKLAPKTKETPKKKSE
ncbi:MAG: hypothetical protein MPJ25_10760, partial [Pirellulales bacterium]|nr:hypothetical protein [Pirellulales bacterium]